MTTVVELEIPPVSDHLALVRLVVDSAVKVGGTLADRRTDDLRLAVSEGCSNALDAQRAIGSLKPIHITIAMGDGEVRVSITDHAGGFDPDSVDPIPAATDPHRLRHERGLGIPLMQSLVDEVTFTRTDDGTVLQLAVFG